MDAVQVSQAVVLWLGRGQASWPQRDEQRVVERLGAAQAAAVMPLVRDWEREFFASDAFLSGAGLAEVGERAAARFRALHPEATDEAVQALAWAYTYGVR